MHFINVFKLDQSRLAELLDRLKILFDISSENTLSEIEILDILPYSSNSINTCILATGTTRKDRKRDMRKGLKNETFAAVSIEDKSVGGRI